MYILKIKIFTFATNIAIINHNKLNNDKEKKKMKKKLTIFLLTAVLMACVTYPENMSAIKSSTGKVISDQYVEDLQGNYHIYEALLSYSSKYRNTYTYSIAKFVFDDTNKVPFYTINLEYRGNDWQFINEYKIMIDDKLYTVKDNKPNRNVIGYGVTEHISGIYHENDDIIKALKASTSVKVQGGLSEISIVEPEDLSTIKEFI